MTTPVQNRSGWGGVFILMKLVIDYLILIVFIAFILSAIWFLGYSAFALYDNYMMASITGIICSATSLILSMVTARGFQQE